MTETHGIMSAEYFHPNALINCQMDLVHISGFLSSGSRHSWVNFKSSEWESTTNRFFEFPFAQRTKEKLHDSVFMTFKKIKK